MKVITIRQPWASLIACGAKIYETRSWPTRYRGPIAIHAGVTNNDPLIVKWLCGKQYVTEQQQKIMLSDSDELPHGAIIATAELVDVWRIRESGTGVCAEKLAEDNHSILSGHIIFPDLKEQDLGDWTDGRYAWELRNVKILPEPVKIKGRLGLWNWEPGAQKI